jgi:hypothetical protein
MGAPNGPAGQSSAPIRPGPAGGGTLPFPAAPTIDEPAAPAGAPPVPPLTAAEPAAPLPTPGLEPPVPIAMLPPLPSVLVPVTLPAPPTPGACAPAPLTPDGVAACCPLPPGGLNDGTSSASSAPAHAATKRDRLAASGRMGCWEQKSWARFMRHTRTIRESARRCDLIVVPRRASSGGSGDVSPRHETPQRLPMDTGGSMASVGGFASLFSC